MKAFIKTSTLLILLSILLIYYFWHAKIGEFISQEIEANKNIAAFFKVPEIWQKMKGIQEITNKQNQRAIELVGEKKRISDKLQTFSFEILQPWLVQQNNAVSIVVQSPGYFETQNGDSIVINDGAKFAINVAKGEHTIVSPDKNLIISKTDDQFGNQAITYYQIKDAHIQTGEILVANVVRDGKTYDMKYIFNPKTFNGGEFSFQEILHSFMFNEKK